MKQKASGSRDIKLLPRNIRRQIARLYGRTVFNRSEVLLSCSKHRTNDNLWIFSVARNYQRFGSCFDNFHLFLWLSQRWLSNADSIGWRFVSHRLQGDLCLSEGALNTDYVTQYFSAPTSQATASRMRLETSFIIRILRYLSKNCEETPDTLCCKAHNTS